MSRRGARVYLTTALFMLAGAQACEKDEGVCERDPDFSCWSSTTTSEHCHELGCTWQSGCAPVRCETATAQGACEALDHCYWRDTCYLRDPNASCAGDGGSCGASCAEQLACFGEVDCAKHTSSAACADVSPLCRWRKRGSAWRTGQRAAPGAADTLLCEWRAELGPRD